MYIMVMADEPSKRLYDYFDPEQFKDVDLIISCGDLSPEYLTFFATMCHAPVLYVKGNHDGKYAYCPPEGCICIDDDIYTYKGIRIMGLGGCMEYIPRSENQFTERAMSIRILKLWWKLFRKRGIDILVTHAPAYQINDMDDLPHRGFKCFRKLMDKYEPTYFVHGHVHRTYLSNFKRKVTYGKTTVVNEYEFYIIEYPDPNRKEKTYE